MSDLSLVKASIEALCKGLEDLAAVIKKKESALETGMDLVSALLADEEFKASVHQIMAAGLPALMAQLKSMPSDVEGDISLVLAELPAIQKVIQAFRA